MEARFLDAEPQSPKEEETTTITARVERFAVNGTVATYVIRASSGPTERTLGVTYDQCRRLHERLREDGGVLYAARDAFPKQIRGQRLGLRPTPRQASDQSSQLDAWLRFLVRRHEDLPLACQKAVRSFLDLDAKGPWTTCDRAPRPSLFGRNPVTSQRRVFPLGDPQSLPGVTRRGRLDCLRNGAWLPAHVLLTHLSLLVFDPVDEGAGRLLHHVHVTDVLSLLRHGESGVDAPPLHHRCFALGGLDASKTVELRASSARECLAWLRAVARARDRALRAVARLDARSRGHDLCLATLVDATHKETLVTRETDAYGWRRPLRVDGRAMFVRLDVRCGRVDLDVADLIRRASFDHRRGLGAPSSMAHAVAASRGGARGAFWAAVHTEEDSDDERDSILEILVAVDASSLLHASKNDDGASVPRWAALLARTASDVIKEPARALASLLTPHAGRVVSESIVGVLSVVFALYVVRRFFLGEALVILQENNAYHLKASLGSLLGLGVLVLLGSALAAAAAEVDAGPEPCGPLRFAKRRGGDIHVRLVDWRWRQQGPTPRPGPSASTASPRPRESAITTHAGAAEEIAEDRPESEDARLAREACARAAVPLPAGVPQRFLLAVRGNGDEAQRRWNETVEWRREHHPTQVQLRPQPHFDAIKKRHVHFLHKRDRRGHLCSYEVIDRPNHTFRQLQDEGVPIEAIVEHMHFVSCWTYASLLDDVDEVGKRPLDPGGYFLKIIDCRNVGLGDCGGSSLRYFQLVGAVNRHSPERVWRTIVINAPAAFGLVWSIVSPLLEPQVRAKVTVLRSDYAQTLRVLVAPENLPRAFGGDDACDVGEAPEELALRAWVAERCGSGLDDDASSSPSLTEEPDAGFERGGKQCGI